MKKYRRLFNEKKYRSMEVDEDLKEEWLDLLNSIRGIDVVSTCSGHEDGVGQNLGGNKYPRFNFSVMKFESKIFNNIKKDIYDLYKKFSKLKNTKVKLHVWMPKRTAWVMYDENGARTSVFSKEQFEASNGKPVDRVSFSISSTIPFSKANTKKLDIWWNKVLKDIKNLI